MNTSLRQGRGGGRLFPHIDQEGEDKSRKGVIKGSSQGKTKVKGKALHAVKSDEGFQEAH